MNKEISRHRAQDSMKNCHARWSFAPLDTKGIPLPNVPFDERKGIIPSRDGRVIDPVSKFPVPRLYVAGWIKRGPSGVIGTNKPDATATVESMMADIEERVLPGLRVLLPKRSSPVSLGRVSRYVTFPDWQRIDKVEVANGQCAGKPQRNSQLFLQCSLRYRKTHNVIAFRHRYKRRCIFLIITFCFAFLHSPFLARAWGTRAHRSSLTSPPHSSPLKHNKKLLRSSTHDL